MDLRLLALGGLAIGIAAAAWSGAARDVRGSAADAGIDGAAAVTGPASAVGSPCLAARGGPDAAARASATVEDREAAREHVVRGRVVGPDGKPVAGARVFVVWITSEVVVRVVDGSDTARSDDDGAFRLAAPAGQSVVQLVAFKRRVGYRLMHDVLVGERVEVALVPGWTVHGTVSDVDERPVSGARVSIPEWPLVGEPAMTVTTDAQGRYAIADVPFDPSGDAPTTERLGRVVTVDVFAEGFILRSVGADGAASADRVRVVDVTLFRGWTLRGRVVDRATRAAVGGVQIRTAQCCRFPRGVHRWIDEAQADEAGRFTISGLAPSELAAAELSLSADDRAGAYDVCNRTLRTPADGEVAVELIELDRTLVRAAAEVGDAARPSDAIDTDERRTVTGRVRLPSGVPARGASVQRTVRDGSTWRPSHQCWTDEDGRFVLHVSRDDRPWDLRVMLPRFATATIAGESVRDRAEAEVVLLPERRIEGRIVDEDGDGVRATVFVRDPADPSRDETRGEVGIFAVPGAECLARAGSDDDGRFRVEQVAPGVYDLHVARYHSRHGYGGWQSLADVSGVDGSRFVEIRVPGKRPTPADDGRPPLRHGVLRVLDPATGLPIASPVEWADWTTPSGEAQPTWWKPTSLGGGRYRVDVVAGRHRFRVSGRDVPSQEMAIEIPDSEEPFDLTLRPRAGAVLRVVAVAPEGVASEDVVLTLSRGDPRDSINASSRDGSRFEFRGAAAGRWCGTVSVLGRDDLVPATPLVVDVPASGVVERRVDLVECGRLTVRWTVRSHAETDDDGELRDARPGSTIRVIGPSGLAHATEVRSGFNRPREPDGSAPDESPMEETFRVAPGRYRVVCILEDAARPCREATAVVRAGDETTIDLGMIDPPR